VASDVVALDLVHTGAVLARLAESMEEMARARDCRAVHTAITCAPTPAPNRMVELMCGLGHRLEGVHLCKPVSVEG
jgi:hypothetical protein